ncbi:MAG TPA: PRC-barrel domain-containing protein [Deltaproteobacteria bacterium]|nr:PRC-barrel domain-containing protein [Deltaproteobacteria bacterium]
MDIALNAHVECTDGRVGRVENIIFNPVTERVTHLVVRGNDLANTMRLVPERQVKDATPEVISLAFDRKKFDKMKNFIQEEYIPANVTLYMAERAGWNIGTPAAVFVEHEAVPGGSVSLHKKAVVEATDGRVGTVDELLVEKKSGRITHLILKEGHLWGKKDVLIPVSLIDHYEEKKVVLKIDKDAVEQLPVVDLKEREG